MRTMATLLRRVESMVVMKSEKKKRRRNRVSEWGTKNRK
jgi:hypothetical protein